MPEGTTMTAGESLKALTAAYYGTNHQRAQQGTKVVWIAIIVPVELLHGFDLVIAVPENHAAMCAAKGVGAAQCEEAERRGYSTDLCSYARIDLGTVFADGGGSPSMGMPRPDLLISNTNNCSLLSKWFDVHRRRWGVPHVVLDVPYCYAEQRPQDLEYILSQYRTLIATLEQLTGQRCDHERVAAAVEQSRRSWRLWKQILELARRRPSPLTAFDTFLHMAPYITSLRGTPELVAHLRILRDELEGREAAGRLPVPEERFRLLWDSIAPWHQLRRMSSDLAARQANVVAATYTACIGSLEGDVALWDPADEPDPLRVLARQQNFSVCPQGLRLRYRSMQGLVQGWGVDGIVFGSNRSCKVYSLMQLDLQRRFAERDGLPSVMIDVDHADARKYSQGRVQLQLEALLERIEEQR